MICFGSFCSCVMWSYVCSYLLCCWIFFFVASWRFKVTVIRLSGGQLSVICLFMLSHLERAEAFVPQQTASCRVLVSTAAVCGDQCVLLGCWQNALVKSAKCWQLFCWTPTLPRQCRNISDRAWIQNTNGHVSLSKTHLYFQNNTKTGHFLERIRSAVHKPLHVYLIYSSISHSLHKLQKTQYTDLFV